MSLLLQPEELYELTGKKHCRAQRTVLTSMGFEHRVRPDGSLVVLRSHLEQQLGVAGAIIKEEKKAMPNFAARKARNR